MKKNVLLLWFALCVSIISAQSDQLAHTSTLLQDIPLALMPAQNNAALMAEETARLAPGIAPRYAENISVNISPNTDGLWETTKDGIAVWRLRIRSTDAYSINLGFGEYEMPSGGKLFLYDPAYKKVMGPFTPADNEEHDQLWTPIIGGDELVIELQVPLAQKEAVRLKLSYVNHAFQNFGALASGSCNLDVICNAADGWGIIDDYRDIIQSVAVISTGGGTFCTGFLVNNVQEDCTPFFMTANHCGINNGNAASLVTYWNFINSTCRQPNTPASGAPGDGQLNDFNTGAIFRSASANSDFTLVELDDPVSPTANAFFAGWDASASPISSAIAVHHPSTDEKRISFEEDALQFTTYGGGPTSNFTHVRVVDWDTGTTEPGSSGSPLFDQDKRVVGQLHGGGAACGNNQSDWYGAFAVSWNGQGSPSTRLKDWLDPNNTGTLVINGRYAASCSFALIADPVVQTVCTPQNATYQITASEAFASTVALSTSGLPAGVSASFNPGTVSPGASSTLVLHSSDFAPGNYTFQVNGNDGSNTASTTLTINVLDGSLSAPQLLDPTNNETDVFTTPVLSWAGDNSGNSTYEVQIATNNSFSNIIESATVNTTSYQATMANTGLTTYYWRVRTSNECGNSAFSSPFQFTTGNITCINYRSSSSTTISEVGEPLIQNDIFIADDYTIADISVDMLVDHTYVGDLSANLLAPTGANIQLFDRPGVPASQFGCNSDNLNVSFNTSAPNDAISFEESCNGGDYAIEGSFMPLASFAPLSNQSSQGLWTLEIEDHVDADGGALLEWSVTVCYIETAVAPILVNNNVLEVPRSDLRIITSDHLETTDENSSPSEIIYTITATPTEGFILLNGAVLQLGSTFSQQDINSGLVSYAHNGGTVLNDDFFFDVTNAAGVSLSDNIFLIEILVNPMEITITQTENISCNDGDDASISIAVSEGLPPYEYALEDGAFQSENTFTGLSAGTYTVSVMDAQGTISEASITIDEPSAILANSSVTENTININTAGGTPPYMYSLDGGETNQSEAVFTNVPNGQYIITITDANGCSRNIFVTVSFNNLAVVASIENEISCHDTNDASISVSVTGGTPAYTYQLNDGDFQNENTFDNLAPGTYQVRVRDNDDFTQLSNIITITSPTALIASSTVNEFTITTAASGGTAPYTYSIDGGLNQQADSVFVVNTNGTYTITVTDANDCTTTTQATVAVNTLSLTAFVSSPMSCHNANDAIISTIVNGGTAPFEYSLNGVDYQMSSTFENVVAGIYQLWVRDSEGFTTTSNGVNVANPALLSLSASVNGNNITTTATNGVAPLMYSLDGGMSTQISNTFNNLANGTYTVTVIDANDCTASSQVSVSVNTLGITAFLVNAISCHNASDASIVAEVSGGVAPLEYSLDGENFQSEDTFNGLAAGTYQIVVRDAEGFTQTSAPITISNPALLSISTSVSQASITAMATGGTAPLVYSLDGGMSTQVSPIFNDLSNGTYTVTVIDANDCSATSETSVSVNTLSITAFVVTELSCHNASDASIVAEVNGGVAPLEYSLDGENFQSEDTFNSLAAGTYQIVVRDAEGFTQTSAPLTISNPAALSVSTTITDNNLSVVASGGTAPLMYSLDGGTTVQASPNFNSLANGNYTLTVIDANGCSINTDVTINFNSLVANAVIVTDIFCHGINIGEIEAQVTGGTPPYQYSIDGGENYQSSPLFSGLMPGDYNILVLDAAGFSVNSNTVSISNPPAMTMEVNVSVNTIVIIASGGTGNLMYSLDGINFQNSNVFENVADGMYQATVRDENNCAISIETIIAVDNFQASVSIVSQMSCHDSEDASIEVSATGGIAPYSYSLDGQNFQASPLFENLTAGVYTISIRDDVGTTISTEDIEITAPAALSMSLTTTAMQIEVSVNGGTPAYTYSLDGQSYQAENLFTGLAAGEYEVWAQDANGCTVSDTISVLVSLFENTLPHLSFELYPNPNQGQFDLLLDQHTEKQLNIRIYNAAGQLIRAQQYDKQQDQFIQRFDLTALPDGLYQIIVTDGQQLGVKRLIIQD